MKFPSVVLVTGVGLSSHANAFVPSAFSAVNTFSGRLPPSNVKNPSIVDTDEALLHETDALLAEKDAQLSIEDEEHEEIKELKKEGKMSTGLLKLIKYSKRMKDFDPDEEGSEKKAEKYVNVACKCLEEDMKHSSRFETALSLLQLLRSQMKKRDSLDYSTYSNNPEFPDVDLSGAMKKMDGFPPINQLFSPKKIVQLLLRQAAVEMIMYDVEGDIDNAETMEEAYQACFTDVAIKRHGFISNFRESLRHRVVAARVVPNFLPAPYAVDNWEKDSAFARQFFCGTNPVMIEVCSNPESQLSKNLVDHFGKEMLQDLADKNQLLFVSYDDLADLKVNPHQQFPLPQNDASGPDGGPAPQDHPAYFYAPIVVFKYDYDKDELNILGIQLERDDDARVYTRDTCGENEWLVVKVQVLAADSQMHQWVSHLGNTHLTMEPHIIAIYNTLRRANHPLYTFLKQNCRDTLLLNWAARETLASNGAKSFGDYQSSVGVGQFSQLIGKMWSRYKFFEKSSLPNELASRGFTEDVKIPAYLYREDGMKLWNAIGKFATDFVDEVFDSDEAVASDPVVQEWAKETTDPNLGAVPGFPTSFEDKETVAKVLQTIMWTTSGLHAAVNFPQYNAYAYVPNKALHLRADLSMLPKDDSKIREWMFENMLPIIRTDDEWLLEAINNGAPAIDSLKVANLLTTPSNHCLDDLSDKFEHIGKEAYDKFLKNLNDISEEIEARNKKAKKANKPPYDYLNPSNVPASIDI